MGYPTDVRVQQDGENAGINLLWDDSGSPLAIDEQRSLVNVSNKAGKVLAMRLFTKHPSVWITAVVDGENILEVPSYSMLGYGCCIEGMLTVCRKYDTVNDRYIIELARPVEFGNGFSATLVNWSGAVAKAFSHIIWAENT